MTKSLSFNDLDLIFPGHFCQIGALVKNPFESQPCKEQSLYKAARFGNHRLH